MKFEDKIPIVVKNALYLIESYGYKAYIVGGAVRDLLLFKLPVDFDITTSATPEQILEVFKSYKTINTGIKHGTIIVIYEKTQIEITTFRCDGRYINNRKPENVKFLNELSDDLKRRDFTINAIAFNFKEGIIDLNKGIDDLNNKIIRTIGEPDDRFSEDGLRLLRAVRFASCLDFKIEKATRDSIFLNKEKLKNISKERIKDEFLKIICGKKAGDIIIEYFELFSIFIPELIPLKNCVQNTKYHIYDVLNHTTKSLDFVEQEPLARLCIFFHDFGKPECQTTDFNGINHFKNHQKKSAVLSNNILRRLHFDNKTIDNVKNIIEHHDYRFEKVTKSEIKKLLILISLNKNKNETSDIFYLWTKVKIADIKSHSGICHHEINDILKARQIFENIIKNNECFSLKQLEINGNDLLKIGFNADQSIELTLKKLLNMVVDEEIKNEKSELLKFTKNILKENGIKYE